MRVHAEAILGLQHQNGCCCKDYDWLFWVDCDLFFMNPATGAKSHFFETYEGKTWQNIFLFPSSQVFDFVSDDPTVQSNLLRPHLTCRISRTPRLQKVCILPVRRLNSWKSTRSHLLAFQCFNLCTPPSCCKTSLFILFILLKQCRLRKTVDALIHAAFTRL